jgi:hypothetical protein
MIFSTFSLFSSAAAAPAPLDLLPDDKIYSRYYERNNAKGLKNARIEQCRNEASGDRVTLPRGYTRCNKENYQLVCMKDGELKNLSCEKGHFEVYDYYIQ